LESEFERRVSELLRSDKLNGALGISQMAQFQLKAGISSLTSGLAFFDEVDDEALEQVPDYVLSDSLECDLDAIVSICAMMLKQGKYLPDNAEVGSRHGALPEGVRDGVYVEGWEDYSITDCRGEQLYTEVQLDLFGEPPSCRLGAAFWLIVQDICNEGRMLSEDWYHARIVLEYFREYPIRPESAFLIGMLYKELCVKEQYEGDLSEYYSKLAEQQESRKKGTEATKRKAEEQRDFCVRLFAKIALEAGPRIMMAPPEQQARELRRRVLEERPADFQRAGRPYSEAWFLQNVIEDRRLDIVQMIEASRR